MQAVSPQEFGKRRLLHSQFHADFLGGIWHCLVAYELRFEVIFYFAIDHGQHADVVHIRGASKHLSDAVVNAAAVAVANALLFVPAYLAQGGAARLAAVPLADLALQALYQGILAAVVALVAFAFAIQRLGAAAAASFTPLAPVLVAVFGWFMLGDTVDAATAAGLAAVAAGVVIANRGFGAATSAR